MSKPNSIVIDGVEYLPKVKSTGAVRICVLQRGWVVVGRYERKDNNECVLRGASVIRTWGTTKGLGEIAMGGPTPSTKLDPCGGDVRFDYLAMVVSLDCNEDKWNSTL